MLTVEQLYNNEKRYMELLGKLNIDLVSLYNYLEKADYFRQPASNTNFKVYAGGLVEYQLALYDKLAALVLNEGYTYTDEDIIKVTLFNNFYRGFMYDLGQGRVDYLGNQVPTYKTKDPAARPTYGDIGFSSYMHAKHFVDFTDEQAICIVHAKPDSYLPDEQEILHSYQLLALLRIADAYVRNLV